MLSSKAHSQNNADSGTKVEYFDIKKLYSFAIQEDVKSILSTLDTLTVNDLDQAGIALKAKYLNRFVTNDDVFDYKTDDPLLTGLIDIYKQYWRGILLKTMPVNEADSLLKINLFAFVKNNYPSELNSWNDTNAASDPMEFLESILTHNNYFNNVTGKTGNLYDIYIWRSQDTVNYSVELAEVNVTVPLIFMNDIVTMGWEEYATFGKYYPGGWPKEKELYCVSAAYDTTKENFLVSYLAHEAQHFSDLKIYKDLSSWQLEYRAKLTELTKANETLYRILSYFIRGSKDDKTLSHPYAEFLVISDMSQNLFNESFVSDLGKWESVSTENINKAASELLKKNSLNLLKNNDEYNE